MKIQRQVSTLSQSATLFELGVKGMDVAQYFWVDFSTNSGHEFTLCRPLLFGDNSWLIVQDNISAELQQQLDSESLNACGPVYPAYTTGEFGEMLAEIDNGNVDATSFYNWHHGIWDGVITGLDEDSERTLLNNDFECDSEAEVRGDMVMWLIENKMLTAEECNSSINEQEDERSVATNP